jgi:PcfJ-like protein
MVRSLNQRRQEAERARVEAFEASLRQSTRPPRQAPNFKRAIDEAAHGFQYAVLRDGGAWQPQMKTRDAGRLRLGAARHLFARYPVAAHLEQIWIDSYGLDRTEVTLRKSWYVAAAGGGSLFKAGASVWLSRKEVHAFLNPLGAVTFDAAIWQAIARSYTDDPGTALRIAHTALARTPRAELSFWRDVVRFFCANQATVEDMNDFHDYLADCYRRSQEFSLKGRTLGSLRRQMHDWHHDLEAVAVIEAARRRLEAAQARARGERPAVAGAVGGSAGGSWAGAAIEDWSWSPTAKDHGKRDAYAMVQLRTATDLVTETRLMQHCVASYAAKCMAGNASIWSLRHRHAGNTQRLLTLEVDRQRQVVQIRGFANRLARSDERKILERWAKARSLRLPP